MDKLEEMHKAGSIFLRSHAVLPVIHAKNADQVLRNADIADNEVCDGIFLINHGIPYAKLQAIEEAVISRFPDLWIGVNYLEVYPEKAFYELSDKVSGFWTDNPMINEDSELQPLAESIARARAASGWPGLYFGGAAFKYQSPVKSLARVAEITARYVNVVTTSGDATGKAPSVEKIKTMKNAIGDKPLAIASGITPENVHEYLGIADIFLVATGISKDFYNLDAKRVKLLMNKVRSFKKN